MKGDSLTIHGGEKGLRGRTPADEAGALSRFTLAAMHARKPLEDAVFASLDAMMAAYAEEAVHLADALHGVRLDYAEGSVLHLEAILDGWEAPAGNGTTERRTDVEHATRLWGGYFGELLRRKYDGAWEMSVYPGGSLAVPALVVKGSRIYPLMKVHRRLTLGEGENISEFYRMVVSRLGPSAGGN